MAILRRKGFSVIEIMIAVAIVIILLIIAIWAYRVQLLKGRDVRRKADLDNLKTVIEDFYNDNECYPGDLRELTPDYVSPLPVDPVTNELYSYTHDGCHIYRIYAKLDYEQDSAIVESGCGSGCGPGGGTTGGSCVYNFGVCSANANLESCESCRYACQGETGCNELNKGVWNCPKWYCEITECEENCNRPANFCTPK